MKKEYEERNYNFEIRSEKQDGTVILSGKPILYDSVTDLGYFDEVIEKGALNDTNLKDVRFLINHNTSMVPLARSRNNTTNSTMKFSVDDEGMNLDWVKLDVENNTDAKNLASAIERGDLSGMSFMFAVAPDGDSWEGLDTDHPTRHIHKIAEVLELSAVTFPAYEETSISISQRAKLTLDSVRSALDSAKDKRALDSALELEKAKIKYLTQR